jgi:hypothetical protein
VGPSASSEASSLSFSSGQPSACSWRCSGFSIFSGAYALFWPRLRPAPPYLFYPPHSSSYDVSALYVTAPHNFL